MKNPFSYGNPITDSSRFIGRTREISQILTRLRNPEFESTSLIGERRIGKTSLLKQIDKQELIQNMVCVHLDLQLIQSHHEPADFWDQVLDQLLLQIPSEALADLIHGARDGTTFDSFELNDLFGKLSKSELSIVLLLDEFEHIAGNTNFGPDFFGGLRTLAIHHKLALVTSSTAELSSLSHSEAVRSSPLFNIFATIRLAGFTSDEVELLIQRYLEESSFQFRSREIEYLKLMGGEHPYFLQIACYFLFDAYMQRLAMSDRLKYTFHRFTDEARGHLSSYWRHSSDDEKIVLTILALLEDLNEESLRERYHISSLQKYYHSASRSLFNLHKRGLLIETNGTYRLFSSILKEYIREELISHLGRTDATYEEWLNASGNQRKLSRLKGETSRELKENVLPQVRDAYRNLIVNWLTNPETLSASLSLLRQWLAS